MQLEKPNLRHLCTQTHEGKVILMGTVIEGNVARLYYTIKQDGFEDSALQNPGSSGWEAFKPLSLPNENAGDPSVEAREQAELTDRQGNLLLHSIYTSADLTANAPAQMVSHDGYLCVFRQSTRGTLLVDRFVLDGMTNTLAPKLEVRFKRSRQRYKPQKDMKITSSGQLESVDSLDFRDILDNSFHEPTTEICPHLLNGLHDGWFGVVITPTLEQDSHRWHIFTHNSRSGKIDLLTLRAGDDSLFDLQDDWFRTIDPITETTQYNSIPGITNRALTLQTGAGQALTPSQGLTVTLYDVQREQQTQGGPQLVRETSKVLLAVPTAAGIATLSFTIATDGRLAQIARNVRNAELRSEEREILLPIDLLDNIRPVGDSTDAPAGVIAGMSRSAEDDNADRVRIQVGKADKAALGKLRSGDTIKVSNTASYNGLYQVVKAEDGSFVIDATFTNGEMGEWEKVEDQESGLIFDGMLTGYEKTAGGKLKVYAFNHGLAAGDLVQITGDDEYSGEYPVIKHDDDSFTINRLWANGAAVNIKLESRKRRGLVLDGKRDWISAAFSQAMNLSNGFTVEAWVKLAGGADQTILMLQPELPPANKPVDAAYATAATLALKDGKFTFSVTRPLLGRTSALRIASDTPASLGEWVHVACSFNGRQLHLLENGVIKASVTAEELDRKARVAQEAVVRQLEQDVAVMPAGPVASEARSLLDALKVRLKQIPPALNLRVSTFNIGTAPQLKAGAWQPADLLQGQAADVRLWTMGCSDKAILDAMHLQLTGRETGLSGQWRLGGIAVDEDGSQRVFDFSVNANHGIAHGAPYAGGVVLDRTLRDGKTEAVKFSNDDLFAVREGALYVERFEFRADKPVDAANADGKKNPIFAPSLWGQLSRASEEKQAFDPMQADFEFDKLADGWQSATSRFLIPEGVRLLRSFEVTDVSGDWSTLEVRKHTLKLVSDTVTLATLDETARLTALAESQTEQAARQQELVNRLRSQERSAQQESERAEADPLNYWCTFTPKGNQQLRMEGVSAGDVIWQIGATQHGTQRWKFDPLENEAGWFKIMNQQTGKCVAIWDDNADKLVRQEDYAGGDNQKWSAELLDDGHVKITSKRYGTVLEAHKTVVGILTQSWHSGDYQRWKLTPEGAAINDRPAAASMALDTARQQRINAEVELARLNQLPAADPRDLLVELAAQENEEAAAVTRQKELEHMLADVADAQKRRETGQRRDEQQKLVERLRNDESAAQRVSDQVGSDPLNFWCTLTTKQNGNLRLDGATRGVIYQNSPAKNDQQRWKFEPLWGGWFKVINKKSGKCADVDPDGHGIHQYEYLGNDNQQWRIEYLDDGYLKIVNRRFNQVFDAMTARKGDGFVAHGWHGGPNQRWKLAIDGEAINDKPAGARNALEDVRRRRADAEAELARLNTALSANDSQRAAWENELKEIQSKLGRIRPRIAELTTACLNHVTQVNRTALDMPALTDLKDPRGLLVQGALLAFARPAGRLHAMESCTGRVTISYLDVVGNLRQAHYDTAYDADGRGEEWLPDAGRTALSLDGHGLALPVPADVFGDLSNQITVECWVRGGSDLPRSTLFLAAQDTSNKRCLGIQLPNEKGEVVWEAGQPASGAVDSLVKAADAGDYRGHWTHWAFVKDAEKGEMRIYLNGKLWAKNDPKATEGDRPRSQVLGGISLAALGGMPGQAGSWQGQVCELRIWNVALGEREIETNSVLTLSGNEPGLVAYFPFNEGQGDLGRDHAGAGHHIATGGVAWAACTAPIGRIAGAPITLLNQPMTFDGARDFVQAPPLNLDFRNGFTIEARVEYNSFKTWSRIIDLGNGPGKHNILLANKDASKRLILQIYDDKGKTTELVAAKDLPAKKSIHVAATVAPDGMARLYIDGEQVAGGSLSLPAAVLRNSSYVGKSNWNADGLFDGQMDYVRLYASELSAGTVGQLARSDSPGAAVVCAEYSRVRVDAQRRKTVMMLRCLALAAPAGAQLLDEQRIEALEMNWIGNAQINPTLIGYIEGPPPLPSENLTEEQDYNGATSVELIQSSDVEYSWTREDDVSLGAELEVLAGMKSETSAGVLIQTSVEEVKSGLGAKMDFAYHWQNASTVGASHSLMKSDRLELRGSQESEAHFPHLGRRFIPKNIGYALVSSGVADIFVSKLKRSGRMIGYQVLPVEGVPVDVNTVTFLINPAYTMSGSLDGLTGSRATSDRFFQHVPEMRNQYGSLYPASYFRIKEAYDLKNQIDQQDKTHEAYFNQFNSHLVDEASLNRQAGSAGDNAGGVQLNSPDRWDDDKVLSEQIKTRELELEKLKNTKPVDQAAVDAKQKEIDSLRNQETERKSKDQGKRKAAAADRQNQIDSAYTDHSARANATESFSSWQKKMETLLIRAGKRNIVNTYVWDGDGGFHAEEQQFASTVEHSIGGSFDFAAAIGGQGSFALTKVLVELSAYAKVNLTQTMSKTERGSNGLELHVDLSGVESRGITDYRDNPILPGEKVDRYRFMSFFLENSSDHWHDFFNNVVDPEWLASNDEEARALRQAQSAQPNKVWRVLHRVTYVERPALIGFGRAAGNKGNAVDDIRALREQLNNLQGKVEKMHTDINNLLGQLLTTKKQP